ncbi:hypothetical protein M8J77_003704 [Diaphorina citri]|nr:hypothetical protein M8J77_003704 [Diaphorina citri]
MALTLLEYLGGVRLLKIKEATGSGPYLGLTPSTHQMGENKCNVDGGHYDIEPESPYIASKRVNILLTTYMSPQYSPIQWNVHLHLYLTLIVKEVSCPPHSS